MGRSGSQYSLRFRFSDLACATSGTPKRLLRRSRQKRRPRSRVWGAFNPEDGVIHVAGPYIWGDSHAPRVESLKVQEGDDVHGDRRCGVRWEDHPEASVAQAQAQTAKARRRVEQVKAGASKPDVAAQQAEISRLEAEAQHAKTELGRHEALRATDDATVSEVEARRSPGCRIRRRRSAASSGEHADSPGNRYQFSRGGSSGSGGGRAAGAPRFRGQYNLRAGGWQGPEDQHPGRRSRRDVRIARYRPHRAHVCVGRSL